MLYLITVTYLFFDNNICNKPVSLSFSITNSFILNLSAFFNTKSLVLASIVAFPHPLDAEQYFLLKDVISADTEFDIIIRPGFKSVSLSQD